MNTINGQRLALFVGAYFIITMAWAYPWHILWFHDVYRDMGAFTRDAPVMSLGILAVVIQGATIGYLYPFFDRVFLIGGHPIIRAVIFNLVIGLMTYTAMGFATAAKFAIEPVGLFLAYHTIFQFIQFVLTGMALGWIYRR
ncbi:MAG: hypothetical protein AAF442_07460 [Pseudomonadota bacterium]